MACSEPRFTNDVDMVADLPTAYVDEFFAAFPPPEFYVAKSAALEAIGRRSQFSIIHLPFGLKIDVIVPKRTEFALEEMSRVRRITSDGEYSVWFASLEDVVLNKLLFYRQSGSDKHVRDIAGMLNVMADKPDRQSVETWVDKLVAKEEWNQILNRLDGGSDAGWNNV